MKKPKKTKDGCGCEQNYICENCGQVVGKKALLQAKKELEKKYSFLPYDSYIFYTTKDWKKIWERLLK